jgi:hypothetical protein
VTISSGLQPFSDLLCGGDLGVFFGAIDPLADVDWFQLQGAVAGDVIAVDVAAQGYLSDLDTMVAVASPTALLAMNDDAPNTTDSALAGVTLTGAGPFYVAITAFGDADFNGSGGQSRGHYVASVLRNGSPMVFSPTLCRPDDANTRAGASVLVPFASASAPADFARCVADCDTSLGLLSPLFGDFTFPVELSEETGAVIPPCAWSTFGTARPAGCGPAQCCTGQAGLGVAPNAQGQCPLAFEISDTGAGLDSAVVSAIQALASFSTFTISTVVREDPAALAASGVDTRCFIQNVIPVSATPPNTCAPLPRIADLVPPANQPDSFEDVVPGTALSFQVNALNQASTGAPCVAATASPQLFRAFIDVVADGVTVVSTRPVIIIVPPAPVGSAN